MPKFELSLSPDYVPSWTVVDAVRELFQNALDQQTTVEGNEMFFDYEPGEQCVADASGRTYEYIFEVPGKLSIGNKLSVLSAKSLLLGASTKVNDKNTIGQFGEGYKVAVLVLLRHGKSVTFYNYGAREVWRPRFKDSKKYGGKILEFDVDKKFPWTSVPDNNLTIVVEGITPEEYQDIVDSNLHLQEIGDKYETPIGDILFDEKHKGKVFVNGLFVCDYAPYTHGYNFKPSELKLDRDRKMADSFQLKWKASNMWATSENDIVHDLIKAGAPDVEYISTFVNPGNSWLYNTRSSIADKALDDFKIEHGANAVPVTTQEEVQQAKENGVEPIVVKATHHEVLKQASKYEVSVMPKLRQMPVSMRLDHWYEDHQQSLSKQAKTELVDIIKQIKRSEL